MKLFTIPLVTLSGAGTTNGSWCKVGDRKRGGWQAIWTGTLDGTFTWQGSNDFDVSQPALATATGITVPAGFAGGNPNGAPGSFLFFWDILPEVEALRPVFTYASGSGNLSVFGSVKGGQPG